MSRQISYEPQREFEIIQYPGRVVNPERMIETLGGITKISKVFGDEVKRLALRYHPKNPYNKPAFGDCLTKCGVLLSIKVRRSKKHPDRPPQHIVSVVGHCKRMFVFDALCDFQYLPLHREPAVKPDEGQLKLYLDKLTPCHARDFEYFDRTDVPFVCLPELFARVDLVHAGIYRNDPDDNGQSDVLGVMKKSMHESREVISFNMTDPFPTKPDPQIMKQMKVKYVTDEQFARVKLLFNQCPIWTRIALLYESGLGFEKLRCIVPSMGFYFNSGPWRSLFVRYGYDPRKDFNSRFYQTFDYRLRFGTGVSEFVYSRKVSIKNKQSGYEEPGNDLVQDLAYPYLDEHKLPRSRQCIVRYCDVRFEKVQDMLQKIPSPMAGAKCNETTGWLSAGFDAQVRQLLCNNIKELLRSYYRKEHLAAEVEVEQNECDEDEEAEYEECAEGSQDDNTELDDSVGNILDSNMKELFDTIAIDSE